MKTYPSKIGLELLIPLAIILGGTGLLMVVEKEWIGLAVILLIILFVGHMLLTTYYQINGNQLTIRSGFIVNMSLDIRTIKRITATRNPISSPAASLDRLELLYNIYDSVLISPKDKTSFIEALLAINLSIVISLKS